MPVHMKFSGQIPNLPLSMEKDFTKHSCFKPSSEAQSEGGGAKRRGMHTAKHFTSLTGDPPTKKHPVGAMVYVLLFHRIFKRRFKGIEGGIQV